MKKTSEPNPIEILKFMIKSISKQKVSLFSNLSLFLEGNISNNNYRAELENVLNDMINSLNSGNMKKIEECCDKYCSYFLFNIKGCPFDIVTYYSDYADYIENNKTKSKVA